MTVNQGYFGDLKCGLIWNGGWIRKHVIIGEEHAASV